ncbi:hypothetical protein [Sorangium sp. So ce131]|uniref:hypothetical protein n=1 Tax=Sorangium sp. So ce131 TaxID=3133282 RepID=UPI003F62F40B
MTRGLLVLGAAVTFFAGSSAHAQGIGEACASSYEQAQQLLSDRAFKRARAELRACVSACPATLARDCQSWLEKVDREMPSVALSAASADGRAPGRVRVLLDGAPLVEDIPAAPVEVDPGRHTFTFEDAAGTRVVAVVNLSPGDKALPIAVRFPRAAPPPPAAGGGAGAVRQRWPLWIAGGGAAALVVGAILGIKGHIDRSALISERCAPSCPPDKVDAIDTLWKAGAISAGVGAVALGAGTVLYFQLDPVAPPPPAAGAALLPGGAGLSLRGSF